jgi:hypothetical protein
MNHARALLVKVSTAIPARPLGVALVLVAVFAVASPVAAQSRGTPRQATSIRLFGLLSEEQFAAQETFDASFGSSRGLFWGGGIEVVLPSGIFADLAASRFTKVGQRAFINNGQAFGLGIPLTAAITPIELTAGYRVKLKRVPTIVPYIGIGAGSYGYQESSTFDDPTDSIDERKFGVFGLVGAEVRVSTSVRASVDVQDTRIAGILGDSGLSQQAKEDDLGGLAVRFRIIFGR